MAPHNFGPQGGGAWVPRPPLATTPLHTLVSGAVAVSVHSHIPFCMTQLNASSTADNTALAMQNFQLGGNTRYNQKVLCYIQTSNSKEFPLMSWTLGWEFPLMSWTLAHKKGREFTLMFHGHLFYRP